MKPLLIIVAGGAIALSSGAAFAQDPLDPAHMDPETDEPVVVEQYPEMPPPGETGPADTMPTDPAPADPAPVEQAPASFTDEQVAAFAAASLAMRELRSDTALDEAGREARAAQIVTEHGLDNETFFAMRAAMQNDPGMAARVQQAVDNQLTAPED